jgi:predicted site-specific integrase-resolvase
MSHPHDPDAHEDCIKVLILKPRLRLDEAALLLNVAPRTIRNYLQRGQLTGVTLPSGRYQVKNDAIFKRYL